MKTPISEYKKEVNLSVLSGFYRLSLWLRQLEKNNRKSLHGECSAKAIYDFWHWLDTYEESWNHKITSAINDALSVYEKELTDVQHANRLIICDECGFSKAVNHEEDTWRNICPHCSFSFMLNMCEVIPSIRDYGKFPPPLTQEEEFEAAAKGFPFAGVADKAPEEIRWLVKLTFG